MATVYRSLAVTLLALCVVLVCGLAFSATSSSTAPKPVVSYPTIEEAYSVGELIEETGFYQSIRLTQKEAIYSTQSKYQNIEVRESPYYGKILVLDGVVQLTERDADSYNEMMTHIPMFAHRSPKRVLVIGGGDGYVLSEVLKHEMVEHVDHVDLDEGVIETCTKYFSWSNAWKDPRVKLHIGDGAKFVKEAKSNSYDVIIQDSSDPWTWSESGDKVVLPSSVLYSPEHFSNLHRILSSDGILNIQAETIQIPSDLDGVREWRELALGVGFERSRYGSITISSYPTGQIGFLLCEKDAAAASTAQEIGARFDRMSQTTEPTTYYHPALQQASFVLPLWAQKHIYDESIAQHHEEL